MILFTGWDLPWAGWSPERGSVTTTHRRKKPDKELLALLTSDAVSEKDAERFLRALYGNSPLPQSHSPLEEFLALRRYFAGFLDQFRLLALPKGMGFDPFTCEDILCYLCDASQWNFSFNKQSGKGILYGHDHTRLRRNLVNGLPDTLRMAVLGRKLEYFRILPKLSLLLKEDRFHYAKSPENEAMVCVEDIRDIGMGHSIYMVVIRDSDQSVKRLVVKQEEWPSQSFFSHLLGALNWPYYQSGHVMDDKGCWEISEYLGEKTLFDTIVESDDITRHYIEAELAFHAACGDVFGRGDRHFENYLFHQGHIYPIDISFLFWEGNEEWVKKYLSGGMYEFSSLIHYAGDEERLVARMRKFFKRYLTTLHFLKKHQAELEKQIVLYYGRKDPETERKVVFVRTRLADPDQYFRFQRQLYMDGFFEMVTRKFYKDMLARLVDAAPGVLEEYPWLKMYYLADKERFSCFYLLEDRKEALIAQIVALAAQYLGCDAAYFEAHHREMDSFKERVTNLFIT